MGVIMKQSSFLPLVLAVSTVAFTSGCDQRSQTPTKQNSGGTKLYQAVGDKVPVIVKMPDGNMMRISQKGNWIYVAKTSSGYGEYGQKVSTPKGGAGRDYAKGNIYTDINYLEALAYFDYDWKKIHDPVVEQSKLMPNSVEPKFVQATFERLVDANSEWASPRIGGLLESVPAWWAETNDQPPLTDKEIEELTRFEIPGEFFSGNFTREKVAFYVRLEDHNLLRIGQIDITKDFKTQTKITFHKTSDGYSISGKELHVLGFGGGYEHPVGNQYDEITAIEALSLVNNDPSRILEIADAQSKIIQDSVDPQPLTSLFQSMGRMSSVRSRGSR